MNIMSPSPARFHSLQMAYVNARDGDYGHHGCEHGHAHECDRGCVYGDHDGRAHVHDGGDVHVHDDDRGHGHDRGDDGGAPAPPDGTGSYHNLP